MPEPEGVPHEVLQAFGMQDGGVRPIEQGLVNRHWEVRLGERRYVLRRYHTARTREAIAWEQWLVDFAAKLGWPVPKPLASGSGETLVVHGGRLWAAAPFLDGVGGAQESVEAFRKQGEVLAELHDNLAGLGGSQRPGFGPLWDLDSVVRPSGAGSFEELVAEFAVVRPDLASITRAERERNLRELAAGGVDELPLMPIHGDFQRFNLLWSDGRITGIIDFDFCHRDVLIADIAPVLVPFMPLELDLASALLEGYESVRPLSDREWELMMPMARASLLRWVATLLAEWRRTGEVPGGIERTMIERWAALEEAAPGLAG
jgi:Ser/Thr protein kinase RdoA (MazF antagonist)